MNVQLCATEVCVSSFIIHWIVESKRIPRTAHGYLWKGLLGLFGGRLGSWFEVGGLCLCVGTGGKGVASVDAMRPYLRTMDPDHDHSTSSFPYLRSQLRFEWSIFLSWLFLPPMHKPQLSVSSCIFGPLIVHLAGPCGGILSHLTLTSSCDFIYLPSHC